MQEEKRKFFRISKTCQQNQIGIVNKNYKGFLAIFISFIILSPVLIISIYYNTNCTVIFNSNNSLGNEGSETIILPTNYPQSSFALTQDDQGNIYYADSNNITYEYLGNLGIILVNQNILEMLRDNNTMMLSFIILIEILGTTTINPYGNLNSMQILQDLPIYPYYLNNSISIQESTGNLGSNVVSNMNLEVKTNAGEYIIPFINVEFQVQGIMDLVGNQAIVNSLALPSEIFDQSYSINNFKANNGLFSLSVSKLAYNSTIALDFATQNIMSLLSDPFATTPILFDFSLTRSYDLSSIFSILK